MNTPAEKTRSAQELVVEYLNRRREAVIRQAELCLDEDGDMTAGALANDSIAAELASVICFVETIFDMEPSLAASCDE